MLEIQNSIKKDPQHGYLEDLEIGTSHGEWFLYAKSIVVKEVDRVAAHTGLWQKTEECLQRLDKT